ncbi:FecCD family ABC transporter permease [Anaerocellum diazotrophicum]|uniref:Iron ABC transporter permease n=1 Tax=Caldicellulosiruptor diazotrophicus TaxID=2806205 RepID=A0ABM7NPW8_9FIRM|nr:iron ABC transporter permease [Caldicellulosiruptor diazotrophicus]BCS82164.1 iron ABC transporter permease [Caldicellulosiruptor diazotrophicus]
MQKEVLQREYLKLTTRKIVFLVVVCILIFILAVYAIVVGSSNLNFVDVLKTLIGKGDERTKLIVFNIRLVRVLAAILAGIGLAISGSATQTLLHNPLASPFTLGVSQGAAFGAAVGIILLGGGTTSSSASDSVVILNPSVVVICAFLGAMISSVVVILLAQVKKFSPESVVLSGVALSSLFSAATTIIQYFASDVKIAALVFWTFGDIGRASWNDVKILCVFVLLSWLYFFKNSWDYNAIESGEDVAKSLGVNVERKRIVGIFISSFVTSVTVSFLGIIGFICLLGPHIARRFVGNDQRFLIAASGVVGGFLLLLSDTVARLIISPVVLPVGAVTSFLGAPLFLYLLIRRKKT